jgi:Fe2+ transport system protein B
MVLVGAFLPWVSTGVGNIVGVQGAGLWTMYAAVFGVAGALIPHRRLAGIHAGLLALVATALPLWQVVHLLGRVGLEGWIPGVGLVLTFGGGVVAGFAALSLLRSGSEQPSRA